jgi:ferredoxin
MWNILGGTVPILTPSGYLAHVGDYCNGCGECLEYCQFNAISLDESGQLAVIDSVKCMGCGVCEDMCPVTAITLERDPSKGEPLDLAGLTSQ